MRSSTPKKKDYEPSYPEEGMARRLRTLAPTAQSTVASIVEVQPRLDIESEWSTISTLSAWALAFLFPEAVVLVLVLLVIPATLL